MTVSLPSYYTSLSPFRKIFTEGFPILTYHKIGKPPPGVRIRGLYLSVRLLQRQIKELRAAGFSTVPLTEPHRLLLSGDRTLALTFDDGFRSVFDLAMEPLAATGFRATLFVVADLIGRYNEWQVAAGDRQESLMDEYQICEWLAAGHQLGSHTCTHPWLSRLAPAAAREEITSSKKKLEDRFGVPVMHFCYPYGDWNLPVRDMVLEAGYATACTTDFGVNTIHTHPAELRRITARYRSRNLRQLKVCVAQWWGALTQ
jgi:peptidoglycan/xylan/chitin deacetylase (PgdA/CDA1 family)